MINKKRKILVCAYSCEPGFSSEREIGWKWANLLSTNNDVYVLTRLSNKLTIENYIKKNNINTELKFIYHDLPDSARKWKKGERGLYLYYTLWQFGAYKKIKRMNERFDFIHYVTFGSLLLPNFMFLLPCKFVLGPVGGGENVPLAFINEFTFKGKVSEIIRHTIQKLQKINPMFLLQCIKADKILVRTNETLDMIPNFAKNKTELMLETGVPEELLDYKSKSLKSSDEIKIITIGRFIHSKINLLTLKVILELKNIYQIPFKFYIVGDGHERASLERFCKDNNLSDTVIFTGWIPRAEVIEHLSTSDIYFSTTFKEGGSWAFFEAVAMGIPVCCLKISGPDMIVANNGGLKIVPCSPKQVIADLSKALNVLSTDAILREKLAKNAKNHLMSEMTWGVMMDRVNNIYRELESDTNNL
ncbi:glycosyltransferase family 4 protein [Pseudoalteromonas sp. SR45-4]|uniref:glycosyltransferase family 4 protein n=1 Tax=Pseudoalteromonas sp. SR45-4 TaxID=2760929 RepID=UPI0015FD97D1|nr:glycosyltransferase family 4 protein [Pseudoalteromonas sp. SR45-4]MBB1372607.1 glycosyltransferase family 4 protein [Pseudoalteromonas sp. SR45-4]